MKLLVVIWCTWLSGVGAELMQGEMGALHDLHTSTNGVYWAWSSNETEAGARWDFSTNESTGLYLYDPCGGSSNLAWQGVTCLNGSTIDKLDLVEFNLSGTLPHSIDQLSNLSSINFLGNIYLTGTIPMQIGNLQYMSMLDFDVCGLSGPLPSSITKLMNLREIGLRENAITGSIPSNIGELTSLDFINFSENYMTGTLPHSLSKLTLVEIFGLDYNFFTGTIPSEIGNMANIEVLGVSNCDLHGPIPGELAKLSNVRYWYLQSNELSGTVPPELGRLTQLLQFYLVNNKLSGRVPSELGGLVNVRDLYMDDNEFTGPLPVGLLHGFSALEVLRFQRNRLTGDLAGRFLGSYLALKNVDFSDNMLSGSIPSDLFESAPNLLTVALTQNCFDGSLPQGVCSARNISVLSLDGLGAAEHCKNAIKMPLTGVTLDNALYGTIPDCVWKLRELQVLHLTGNGLSGSISDELAADSMLRTLALAHNKISGSIPPSIQSRKFHRLDLSYNQISGTVDITNEATSEMVLEVNRLSGWYPRNVVTSNDTTMQSGTLLKVLRGNLFSCHYIPEEDTFSEDYSCGSENLEFSLLAFVVTFGAFLIIIGVMKFFVTHNGELKFTTNLIHLFNYRQVYISYLEPKVASKASLLHGGMRRICLFSQELGTVLKIFLALLGLSVVTCLPIYGIKFAEYGLDENIHTTHSFQYHWTLSIAYMKGIIPAVAVLGMWVTVISAMVLFFIKGGPFRREYLDYKLFKAHNSIVISRFTYFFIFLVNVVVTGSVDASYLYLTGQAISPFIQTSIQIAVAVFKVLWNMVLVPQLVKPMKSPSRIISVELLILVFNYILIPSVVTGITSPSCFQGVFVAPDEVESQYDYQICFLNLFIDGEFSCLQESTRTVFVTPLRPPFLYNNLCTSTILTSYIPVYVFVYAIQLFVVVLQVAVLTSLEYSSFPKLLQKGLHGVFWPNHEWVLSRIVPRDILKVTEIISFDILNHLAVFVTFGISSPYLALILIVSVCLKLYMWRVMIGRFAYIRSTPVCKSSELNRHWEVDGVNGDGGLSTLNMACLPILDILEDSLWPIVVSSSMFFACICWDMAGDKVDWVGSIWAPAIVLMVPFLLRGGVWMHAKHIGSKMKTTSDDSTSTFVQTAMNKSQSNPIHSKSVEMNSQLVI